MPSIELTDDLHQLPDRDGPPAFLVFCHSRDAVSTDYLVFSEIRDARDYAAQCEEIEPEKGDWPIYPLWAGHDIRHSTADWAN